MRILAVVMMTTAFLAPIPAQAAAPVPAQAAALAPARAAADCASPTATALAQYFDGTLPDLLQRNNVPGAAVSVVSGGKLVYAHGFGLADVEHNVSFSADTSLVRIASITKLLTWTAVMQQVEAGRLDLNVDVNRYLKTFQIPATYPQPITLQMLMDHTAGFEDRVIGTGARTAADVPALGDYLAANMPRRIHPPGEVSAYSNYGAGLAGYIVSEVSGEPYDLYVQHHILDPLGMTHSTASEPVPATLRNDLAHSYNSDSVPAKPVPFEFDSITPDGSVSATATDMTKFALAHLHDGEPLLKSATARQMHQRSFSADPRLGGYAHGFMDRTINGHRVLMHDGSWEGFLSGLFLVPDCDLGMFVTTNATGGVEALTALVPGFFDRFLPGDTTPAPAATTAAPQAGFYAPARHNESTMEKILVLLGPQRLKVDGGGTIHFKGKDWTPRSDGLYTAADGSDHLVSFTGTHNRRYVATDGPTYQLLGPTQTLPFNLVILLVFGVLALTALAIPFAAVRRRRQAPAPAWRWARWLACGAALLGIAFLALFTMTLFGDVSDFLYGAPLGFRLLLGVPVMVVVLAIGALVGTVRGWRGAGRFVRGHQVALLIGLAALGWFLWQWNLLGWQV
jgi:CubicO group peptidase (beta-lactamase class C family)